MWRIGAEERAGLEDTAGRRLGEQIVVVVEGAGVVLAVETFAEKAPHHGGGSRGRGNGRWRAVHPEAPHLSTVLGPSGPGDRKSTRLNSSHLGISYAVFCLKKKKNTNGICVQYLNQS